MKIALVFLLAALALVKAKPEIYVHMMPWFETKTSNGGKWGIHWTMANQNPDTVVDGKQQIASYYHPKIGAYASGDQKTIDWQLGIMKTSGIAGAFIDWPGTNNYADYTKNKANAEAIIAGVQRAGLKFAIVYEDNNLNLAGVGDKIAQGRKDIQYAQNTYWTKSNYVRVNGAPLLLDFGPQALKTGSQWDQIFDQIIPKPAFVPLWYQSQEGGNQAKGEFCWIYSDFMTGLQNWYKNVQKPVKVGCAYPGFNTFYAKGGWPGPGFSIPFSLDTFKQTFDLAIANTQIVQIATWNDYGEGTVVEPTLEFGTQFVDYIRSKSGTKYTAEDAAEVDKIYFLRQEHAANETMLNLLDQRYLEVMTKFD